MTANVRLVALTQDNWAAVADLVVAPGQEHFVVPNLRTIAETQWYPWVQRRVIMADVEPVGFAAYGRETDAKDLWLHRFMIGANHQRRGYGRAALAILIEEWQAIPSVPQVMVSFDPANAVAEALYISFGFVPGEIAEWGERVARLSLIR
ncbi:MAG TPA: GNAT family N-acetyltransferase [Thermomicrobiales bacterium]|nr:GNAT family N-acetyltransferase [Thermomicrobiales bacterium]